MELERMWINQPSSHQDLHKLNGTDVLAIREGLKVHRAYFLSEPIISMQIPSHALSKGWNPSVGRGK